MKLPQFLYDAINNNTTSLGKHPAFPPDEEFSFIDDLIYHQFNKVMSEVGVSNKKQIVSKLNQLITECKKEEENLKPALQQLCNNLIVEIFDIPEDTITIDTKLVDSCDMSIYRLTPEKTDNKFRFDSIESMEELSNMIYQRRMINCLISGISYSMGFDLNNYVGEIYKINPRLVELYSEIYKYNLALLYNQPDTLKNIEQTNTGCVKVNIGNENEQIVIESQGVIFPILLEFTIRGLLEVASLKGLPEDVEQSKFILSKSDYRLAENWDMRLGIPLWYIIKEVIDDCNAKIGGDIKINFYIMVLSCMSHDEYIPYLQNIFKQTKLGYKQTCDILSDIKTNQEYDEFDDFMKIQNQKYSLNDNDEYTSQELIDEINKNLN